MDESEIWNVSTNLTMNTTSVSDPPTFASILGVEGYYAVVSVLLATLVPAQLFLSVITIVGLCVGKEFKQFKLQRALMIAMVAMGFVSATSVVMFSIAEYLFLNRNTEAGAVFCHGGVLFRRLDFWLRDVLLVFFSVLVFIVIKYGRQKVRVAYFSIALLLVVSPILIVSIVYLFPSVLNFSSLPLDGVVCRSQGLLASYASLLVLFILTSIPPRVISVGIVIAILVFVKQHSDTLDENKKFKVAVLKFLAIVTIMNALLIVRFILDFLHFMSLFVRFNDHETAFVVISHLVHFVLPSVPAIITPLLLMVVFKPLTAAIKTLLLPSCCECSNSQENGTQITMTINSVGSSDKEVPLLRMRT